MRKIFALRRVTPLQLPFRLKSVVGLGVIIRSKRLI